MGVASIGRTLAMVETLRQPGLNQTEPEEGLVQTVYSRSRQTAGQRDLTETPEPTDS